MLRVTELRLPLDHAEGALRPALLLRLKIASGELQQFTVFRRGHDARRKSAILSLGSVRCDTWEKQRSASFFVSFAADSRSSSFSNAGTYVGARPTARSRYPIAPTSSPRDSWKNDAARSKNSAPTAFATLFRRLP